MRRTTATVASTATLLTPFAAPALAAAGSPASASKVYVGQSSSMKWGTVTVRIAVSGKRITDVRGSYPTERPRSAQINNHAGPLLRSEALKAQSANVHTISGATMSSDAFKQSLRSALSKAHL